MLVFWLVMAQVGALVVIDLRRAYKDYVQDKALWKLALHCALLGSISFLVINTVLVVLGADTEMPYIQTHVLQNDPRFLKLQRSKRGARVSAGRKSSKTKQKQQQQPMPSQEGGK